MTESGQQATIEYLRARDAVEEAGYVSELDLALGKSMLAGSEREFLTESAWVIIAAGLSDAVVRRVFPEVYSAFDEFADIGRIVERSAVYRRRAGRVFGHRGKVEGILYAAAWIAARGWQRARTEIVENGPEALSTIPYLGPATSLHLMKNLGLEVAKPDRHLRRVALELGFESPQELCEAVATLTGDPVSVIDLVFWRHAVLEGRRSVR